MIMEFIVYFNRQDPAIERFERQFETHLPAFNFEALMSIDQLAGRLRSLNQNRLKTVVVLFAADWQDLVDILAIREFLVDVKIVLVLPDHRKETISAGHRLRPRYIGYADGSQEDVVAVLEKMLTQSFDKYNMEKQGVAHGK